MTARWKNIGRALCCVAVFGACIVTLLFLCVSWGVYFEELPHLEHGCFTMEDFLDCLPPHELLLFRLGGHDAVKWGYILAGCGVVGLGLFACRLVFRARPASKSGPPAGRSRELTAKDSSAADLTEQR